MSGLANIERRRSEIVWMAKSVGLFMIDGNARGVDRTLAELEVAAL